MGVWKKVALAVALTGNIVLAESFKGDLLLYAPFDGHLDALTGQGGLLSGRFLRNSVAYTGDWKKFERNQPRYVTGRFGEGIFLESGDYGNYARGTRNNLPPDKATGVLPAGLASAGEARITRQSSSLAGLAGVRVNCRAAGAGIVTGEFSLPVAMRYIASVYLKGTSGGEKVRLVFSDKTNQVEEVASVVLTPAWARYYVVLACDEQSKKYGEKTLQEPFQAVFSILSEEPADFSAAAFMVEQTGMHYSNRLTPSSWVPPGSIRGSEVLTLPVAPETFNPEAGTISFWMFLEPGRFNRTFFSVGAGWDTFIMLNEYPSGRLCFTYWGGRNSVPLPQTGQWLHVALTWSGAAAAMYLNGKKTISVTGQKFEPESVWRRETFLMPGHADSGHPFGAKTHLGGVLDEVAVFRRPLSDGEIESLAGGKGPVAILNGLRVRFDQACRVYNRDLTEIPLQFTLRNFSGKDSGNFRVIFSTGEYLRQEAGPFAVPAGGSQEVIYRWPVGRLSPGAYWLKVKPSTGEGIEAAFQLRAGPYRDSSRFPVVAWNIPATYQDIKTAAELGVTVTSTGVSPTVLDWAAECGLSGMAHMHVLAWHKPEESGEAIVQNDGSLDHVNPALPTVQEKARNIARQFAADLKDKPSLTHVIINSEWNSPMDFSEQARAFVLKEYGLDLSRWMTEPKKAWAYLHPFNRLNPTLLGENWFPKDGIVEETDPFYRYHLWWHQGGGNEVVINEICALALKEARPDIVRIEEPILRCPPVKRYRNMDVAEEWFYYENPRQAIVVQENLACVSANRGMRPSGMPQFLFKPGGAAPYAATPPPDMLREVLWLCVARPLCLMTFWGWHRVLSPKGMLTLAEVEEKTKGLDWKAAAEALKNFGGEGGGLFIPEVKEEFARFAREVWQPLGPLFTSWQNVPRKVAAINSFAGNLYGNERWPTMGWLGQALISSGLPFDVLYDQSFAEDSQLLKDKKVVVLANTPAVTRIIFERLKAFAQQGGQIVADEKCRVVGLPGMKVFSPEQTEEATRFLQEHSGYSFVCRTPEVLWNLLECAGARYLVAVNDRREYGPFLGRWQKVKDKGLPQEVTFTGWEPGQRIFDLLSSREIKRVPDGSFTFTLGPTEGRVLVALAAAPERLDLQVSPVSVSRGEKVKVMVSLTAATGKLAGAIPAGLLITEPSGKTHDRSTAILITGGQAVLEMVIPVNAEAGTWQLTVQERATGKKQSASFRVS